jgi:sec-independent protein translocase protein TatB
MLDFGWTELAIIAVIALMVIGPKDLPKVLRTMGQWTRRLRGLAREFQGHIDDVIRESDLEDVRDGVNKVRRTNIGSAVNKMVDPDGRVAKEMGDIDRKARAAGTNPKASPDLDHEGAGDPTGPETKPAATETALRGDARETNKD